MESNKPKVSAKDLFLNLGAFVALYTVVISLINLLFTVINRAYPQINNNYYGYNSSANISWPVAVLVIFFPILIALYWFLEKQYLVDPERQRVGVHKWLSYVTLFLAGLAMAGDLVAVLYFFLNGEELTAGFLLKVLVVLVISSGIFMYFISDIRGRLNSQKRMVWRVVAGVMVVASIVWGFSVLGSPYTQRLYKYDDQKVNDLTNISGAIDNYFIQKNSLPNELSDMSSTYYYFVSVDSQTQKPYEYIKSGSTTYKICAEFNKASPDSDSSVSRPMGVISWSHPAGRHCFERVVNPQYGKPVPAI
ncbi:MAG: DUF5671 domain-containing protein [Minisyncoccia bacterium]